MLVMNAPMYDVQPGQLILVRLDPLASVAALEDETAAQAALRLHHTAQYYLALVASIAETFVFGHAGSIAFSVELLLVGNERPVECPAAVVPIRLSSSTSPLFVHTTCAISAYVSGTDLCGDEPSPVLSAAELEAVVTKARKDQLHAPALTSYAVHEEEIASPLASSIFSSCEPLAAQESLRSPESSHASSVSWHGEGYGASPFDAKLAVIQRSSLDAATVEAMNRLEQNPAPVVFVQVTTDLNESCGLLGVPFAIRAEYVQLKEVWRCWQERIIVELGAKRSQTALWIDSVSAADPGACDDGAHIEYDILDDAAVLPEDAIDERYEAAQTQGGTARADVVENGYIPLLLTPPACLSAVASDISERTCLPSDYHKSTDDLNGNEDARAWSPPRNIDVDARTLLLDVGARADRVSFLRKIVDGGAALLRALRALCARGSFLKHKCASRDDGFVSGRPRKMSKESRAVKMGGRLVRIRSCVL